MIVFPKSLSKELENFQKADVNSDFELCPEEQKTLTEEQLKELDKNGDKIIQITEWAEKYCGDENSKLAINIFASKKEMVSTLWNSVVAYQIPELIKSLLLLKQTPEQISSIINTVVETTEKKAPSALEAIPTLVMAGISKTEEISSVLKLFMKDNVPNVFNYLSGTILTIQTRLNISEPQEIIALLELIVERSGDKLYSTVNSFCEFTTALDVNGINDPAKKELIEYILNTAGPKSGFIFADMGSLLPRLELNTPEKIKAFIDRIIPLCGEDLGEIMMMLPAIFNERGSIIRSLTSSPDPEGFIWEVIDFVRFAIKNKQIFDASGHSSLIDDLVDISESSELQSLPVALNYIMSFGRRFLERRDIISLVSRVKTSTSDLVKLAIISDRLQNERKFKSFLQILDNVKKFNGDTPALTDRLMLSVSKIAQTLTAEELAVLVTQLAKKYADCKEALPKIVNHFAKISDTLQPEKYFKELCKWLYDDPNIDPALLVKYADLLENDYPPTYRDILAAESAIGADGAKILQQKFNITRFDRYHPTILQHLVKMATDPNYAREKPLMLCIVAKADHNGMFYWGRNFEYDDRVRCIVIEVADSAQFANAIRSTMAEYGDPDVVFATAHGTADKMDFGGGNADPKIADNMSSINILNTTLLERELKGIFRGKKTQVVLNSCSTGAYDVENVAQRLADILEPQELVAPSAIEGLLKPGLDVVDGVARLDPLYFLVGSGSYGFELGGRIFHAKERPSTL